MQLELFQLFKPEFKIRNKIRLIELFGGIGSQAKALENIGADFEHYRLVEFDKYACDSYNSVHSTNFKPMDIRDVKGEDLGIVDKDKFTYILTYSFPFMRNWGGSGLGISNEPNKTRKSNRERKDMSNSDNGEYP